MKTLINLLAKPAKKQMVAKQTAILNLINSQDALQTAYNLKHGRN